jgi:hypothetical protein
VVLQTDGSYHFDSIRHFSLDLGRGFTLKRLLAQDRVARLGYLFPRLFSVIRTNIRVAGAGYVSPATAPTETNIKKNLSLPTLASIETLA